MREGSDPAGTRGGPDDPLGFEEALAELGFAEAMGRPPRGGARMFASRPNPYLTYWVHAFPDGTALFTWELAIADLLATLDMQIGSGEEMNQYLYPRTDLRGDQEPAWLAAAIDHAESQLASVDLVNPGPGLDDGGPDAIAGHPGLR